MAEQLRREIALGLIAPGEPLPPERQLARLFHVGRATVQAALAPLKREGLLEARPGRGGGTFVTLTAPVDRGLTDAARRKLRPNRDMLVEALAFRTAIEPIACGLAALFHTEQDLAAIRAAARAASEASDDATFMLHDAEFHAAIAHASGNRFFSEALLKARATLEEVLQVLPESQFWHARSFEEHASIIAAIAAGNDYEAARLMREHAWATDVSARALLNIL